MRKFILYTFFFFCALSLRGQQCFISLGDATGIEMSSSELSQLEAAACALIDSLPAEFRDSFKVFDAGFYLHHPRYDGGIPQVFEKLKAKAALESKYYLLIGRYSDNGQLNKGIKIAVKLPDTGVLSCLTAQKSAGIEYTLNTIGEQGYDNSKPHSILSTLYETLQIAVAKAVCECDTNSNQPCLHDFKTIQDELLRLGFRRIEGVKQGSPYPVNPALDAANIYDYYGREIEFPQLPHERIRLGEELLDGKRILDTLSVIMNEDTTITSIIPLTGAVYIMDIGSFVIGDTMAITGAEVNGARSNDSTVWERAVAASGNYDYVEYWVVLEDTYSGKTYLYSLFTFDPLYGEEMSSGLERSVSLSPMGMALKVLGNAAIDALLQTIEIRLTQDNINTWQGAFNEINKTQVLYSGLSSLIPWKGGLLERFGRAIVDALGVVISNATKKPNYTVSEGFSDFLGAMGTSVLTGYLGEKMITDGPKIIHGLVRLAKHSGNNTVNKISGKCFSTFVMKYGCFTGETIVYTGMNMQKPISELAVGDYVLSGILGSEPEGVEIRNSGDQDLKVVSFASMDEVHRCEMVLTESEISTYEIGDVEDLVWLTLPDQGIEGIYKVTEIKHYLPRKIPEEEVAEGYEYSRITGIFSHISEDVLELRFEGGEVIRVTSSHPFMESELQQWRSAGSLNPGERIVTLKGVSVLEEVTKLEGRYTVYNVTVGTRHNYLVGKEGLLVHNSCGNLDNLARNFLNNYSNTIKKAEIAKWWATGFPKFFERGTFFEKLMAKSGRYAGWTHTSHNFPVIDFYKKVNNTLKVVSMKTTVTKNVSSWMNTNKGHLMDLNDTSTKFIPGESGFGVRALHIYVKDADFAEYSNWPSAIKAAYPNIKEVIISTIEKEFNL